MNKEREQRRIEREDNAVVLETLRIEQTRSIEGQKRTRQGRKAIDWGGTEDANAARNKQRLREERTKYARAKSNETESGGTPRRVTHIAQPRIHLFVLCEVAWLTARPAQKQNLAPRRCGRGRCSTPQRHAVLLARASPCPGMWGVPAGEMVRLPEGLTVGLPVARSIVEETVGELSSRTYGIW